MSDWRYEMCRCGSGFWLTDGQTRYHTQGDAKRAANIAAAWNRLAPERAAKQAQASAEMQRVRGGKECKP